MAYKIGAILGLLTFAVAAIAAVQFTVELVRARSCGLTFNHLTLKFQNLSSRPLGTPNK